MDLNIPDPPETDREIAERLAELTKKDNLLRYGARKLRSGRYLDSYLLFTREVIGNPVKQEFHGMVSDKLDQFPNKKHLILGPRGCHKTTGITIDKGLHRALLNPNISILIFSETKANALKMLRAIKDICENNQKFIEIFGVMGYTGGPTKWTEEELFFMGRKRGTGLKDPTFSAAGVDAPTNSGHYDLIIADDMVSQTNTQSAEQMEKTYETFKTLRPLLNPGNPDATIWMPGTFWDPFDLYNTIIKNHSDEFMITNVGGFGEPGVFDGEAVFPEYGLTREFLLGELSRPGNRARACAWYFGVCWDEEEQAFKEKDRMTYEPGKSILPKDMSICITVDPASSVAEGACDTAIFVGGMDEQSNIWELEHLADRMDPVQIIESIFTINDRWGANVIGIESGGFYNYLKPWLEIEMRKRNCFLNITPLEGWKGKSKDERIMGLQARWANHALILRADSEDAFEQFAHYPKIKRKDLLDAIAYQEEIQSAPTTIRKEIGIYYDKKAYPNLSETDRRVWSRYDPEFQRERELHAENMRDAASNLEEVQMTW